MWFGAIISFQKQFLCVGCFCLHVCFCTTVYLVLKKAREGGSELLCGSRESNLGHLEDRLMLLTAELYLLLWSDLLISLNLGLCHQLKRVDNPASQARVMVT